MSPTRRAKDRTAGSTPTAATAAPIQVAAAREAGWAGRVADRSPTVQRSRTRSVEHAKSIVDAARRLIAVDGIAFTTRQLAEEAGVAMKTFYRHFPGKDELLLAVFEDTIVERMGQMEAAGSRFPDPVDRLHFYVTSSINRLGASADLDRAAEARFITAEHWRLHQLFPDEMTTIDMGFANLVEKEIRRAVDAGDLRSTSPDRDAWFVMKLVMSVYHNYAFATPHSRVEDIAEELWSFCLTAMRGGVDATPTRQRRRRPS